MFKSGKFTSNLYTIRGIFESVLQIGGVIGILGVKKKLFKDSKNSANLGGVHHFSERGGKLKGGVSSERGGTKSLHTMLTKCLHAKVDDI